MWCFQLVAAQPKKLVVTMKLWPLRTTTQLEPLHLKRLMNAHLLTVQCGSKRWTQFRKSIFQNQN